MKDRPRTSLLALRKKPRRNHLRFYCLVTAEAATTLRAGTILPGPQDRRQRSAPVPGRSNAGWHRDVLVFQGLLAFSRCCARGRAHSGLVVHPSVSSVQLKKNLTADERRWPQMRRNGKAREFEAPTGARSWLDWINFPSRFLSVRRWSKCVVLAEGRPGRAA